MMSVVNKFSIKEGEFEPSPEETALVMRLGMFVRLKWFAILGVIIVTLIASRVFHIGFPSLPVYIICVFMVLYNLVMMRQVQSLGAERGTSIIRRARIYGDIHIFLDLLTLTALLHFTGGIENPFIFFFVFHIILASIALHYRIVYLLATAAILMVLLLVGLEYTGAIPHHNLVGFAAPMLYKEGSYILAVLAALATVLYATTYMATAISGELRKRQRQVVQLREQLLEEKTAELEQASGEIVKLEEEKSRFLHFIGMAAHDLKAPLTAIQGFFWVMLGGFSGELTDKQRNMLERSSRRIKELLNLISDLLDIPHIEIGQIVQEMRYISLREVVRRSLDDLRDLAKEKGVKLKVELPRSLPKIQGSSSRLQQVITNLVDNAINYTPEGVVTIRVGEGGKDIRTEVMDTGIGISADDLPRVFDDFFRASNIETRGTGLGLSIAKRIVEAHGGRIWVESPCPESNTGSKFTFTLPKKSKAGRRQR
ncbi:Adaptive-response sensory-kinase SasA [subsurface metagenome]